MKVRLNGPVWKHDCDRCVYLGTIKDIDKPKALVDLYGHTRHGVYVELIRRYSDEGSDYGCVTVVPAQVDRFLESDLYKEAMALWLDHERKNKGYPSIFKQVLDSGLVILIDKEDEE